MSGKRRYGDPRKDQVRANSGETRGRSKRELSAGFLIIAWVVFFLLWAVVGSLLAAAIVFGVLLTGGVAVLNMN
jgi:hypothetical protein